ncbi:hypothetical protein [Longispora urticae]
MVTWLGRHARKGRRPYDLAIEAFNDGLAVPEATVRAAYRNAILTVVIDAEQSTPMPDDGDREEWIAEVIDKTIASHPGPFSIPRRIRRIDQRLTAAGVDWAPSAIAQHDKGPSSEPMTGTDARALALNAVLAGKEGVTGGEFGDFLRFISPAGAASPFASMLEYPDEGVIDAGIADGIGLQLLHAGDVREVMVAAIDGASLEDLREAWTAQEQRHTAAVELCDAVERALDAGELTVAADMWRAGVGVGIGRLQVISVLKGGRSTADRARDAVELLWSAAFVRMLFTVVPNGEYHLLPVLLPPYLLRLIGPFPQQDIADPPSDATPSQ